MSRSSPPQPSDRAASSPPLTQPPPARPAARDDDRARAGARAEAARLRGGTGRGRGGPDRAGALVPRLRTRGRPDPPDGVWIDVAGVTHLFGSEEALLDDLVGRLSRQGFAARAAVADAPAAPGRWRAMAAPSWWRRAAPSMPWRACRSRRCACRRRSSSAMHRLGIERIGQLAALPRAPMVRRFGTQAALRLDQAFGHAFEPLDPLLPRNVAQQRMVFAEPIGRLEDLKRALASSHRTLCARTWSSAGRACAVSTSSCSGSTGAAPPCGSGRPGRRGRRHTSSACSTSAWRRSIRASASRRCGSSPARSSPWASGRCGRTAWRRRRPMPT